MRQYPYTPKKQRTDTPFLKKWGILAADLAKEEGTTCAAIHMRVMKFGTPFQRKASPTICEVMTGKTLIDIAFELNITPFSVYQRLVTHGDAYYTADWPTAAAVRGTTRAEKHWSETSQAGVYKGSKHGWLHPRHPEYNTWRYKFIMKHCPVSHEQPESKEKEEN